MSSFLRQTWRIMFAASLALLVPQISDAGPTRPTRPVRPPRLERPTRYPRPGTPTVSIPTPTPTVAVPTIPPATGAGCPVPPRKILDTRLWHMFWKYPGVTSDLTGRAAFRIPRDSNGIQPDREPASLALVNSSGQSIISMPDLQFTRTGDGSWAASTDQGYVVLQTVPGAYTVSFNFQRVESLSLPHDFFSTGGKLCFTIGDEGVFERFVCQIKPGDGFLCHE